MSYHETCGICHTDKPCEHTVERWNRPFKDIVTVVEQVAAANPGMSFEQIKEKAEEKLRSTEPKKIVKTKLYTDAEGATFEIDVFTDGNEGTPRPRAVRPSFDEVYMDFAVSLARRSTCQRSQVGAVIVSLDNHQVLAMGYNGGPKGGYNACLSLEPGKCGHLHSEINAVIKLNYNDPVEKKLYTTMEPCHGCAVAIINAGIKRVIYKNEYRDHSGLELLQKSGVEVWKHKHT